ncbi:MAG: hypothetical protein V4642_08400 [Bacteroidota bacterium]
MATQQQSFKTTFKNAALLAAFLFFCTVVISMAQTSEPTVTNDDPIVTDFGARQGLQAGLGLILGLPRNEFRDNVTNPGFGIGGHIGYAPNKMPLMFGVEFDYMAYGMETTKVPFNESTTGRVNVDLQTTNSIVSGHLFSRLQPATGLLRPYVDALVGFNYLNTSSSVNDEYSDQSIASSINFQDGAFSYGAGAGVMFKILDGNLGEDQMGETHFGTTLLDFRVRYMKGGEAEYLKRGSIKEDPNDKTKVTYDVYKSRTDMLTFRLGVAISL